MATTFDAIAAVNAIAALERTITTPAPGIISSFDYGLDPIDFESDEIPAIVHIPTGITTADAGRIGSGIYSAQYMVDSMALVIKDVVGQPPLEPLNLIDSLYLQLYELFNTDATKETLTAASGAFEYANTWTTPSFTRRDWPIFSDNYRRYWVIRYTHTFTFHNRAC